MLIATSLAKYKFVNEKMLTASLFAKYKWIGENIKSCVITAQDFFKMKTTQETTQEITQELHKKIWKRSCRKICDSSKTFTGNTGKSYTILFKIICWNFNWLTYWKQNA